MLVFLCVLTAMGLFIVVGGPFIGLEGLAVAELLGISFTAWAGWMLLTWCYRAVLLPDARLKFRRLIGGIDASVQSIVSIKFKEYEEEGDPRGARFVITLPSGRVQIAKNRSSRELVNAILTLRPDIPLEGYERKI
jgi:hypothetical protein